MPYKPLTQIIHDSWYSTTCYIANGHASEFTGQKKEDLVLSRFRRDIEQTSSTVKVFGPETKVRFNNWHIDLVCDDGNEIIAIEGKFKVLTDQAVPDNRKEAFFDLFKLEQYVSSRAYQRGLFLWLTNKPDYLQKATRDSINFSTHQGRVYKPGIPLTARRARRPDMPLPLTLSHEYFFDWQEVTPRLGWYSLAIKVD